MFIKHISIFILFIIFLLLIQSVHALDTYSVESTSINTADKSNVVHSFDC